MGRIEVEPGVLRAAAGTLGGAGGQVSGLAGYVGLAGTGGGAPTATAAALEHFAGTWQVGIASLGEAVACLGACVDAAAGLYEATDRAAMPEGGA